MDVFLQFEAFWDFGVGLFGKQFFGHVKLVFRQEVHHVHVDIRFRNAHRFQFRDEIADAGIDQRIGFISQFAKLH